jgi:hypothetical protein
MNKKFFLFLLLLISVAFMVAIKYERKLSKQRAELYKESLSLCKDELRSSYNSKIVSILHPSYISLENVESLNILDKNSLKLGRDEMLKHKLIITGITRDNLKEFASMVRHIEYIGSFFKDYRVVLFENDSTDGSKIALKSWQLNNPKVKIVSQDFAQKKRPNIKFLAEARNYYLDAITKEEYEDFDMVMMIDMDMENGIDIRGIEDSFSKIQDWDAVCSNGVRVASLDGRMYDMFAFRSDEFPWTPSQWNKLCEEDRTDKWAKNCEKKKDLPIGANVYWDTIVAQGSKIYPVNSPLVPVHSCFGGMAFYKRDFIKDCRYEPVDEDCRDDSIDNKDCYYQPVNEDCEHVSFHQCLREKNQGRMVMNPNQMIRYD